LATTTREETLQEGRDHAPKPAPHLTGEEVHGQQDVAMETDELPPRHGLFALRGRWNAMTFQDIAHRLGANRIAQVSQRTHAKTSYMHGQYGRKRGEMQAEACIMVEA